MYVKKQPKPAQQPTVEESKETNEQPEEVEEPSQEERLTVEQKFDQLFGGMSMGTQAASMAETAKSTGIS